MAGVVSALELQLSSLVIDEGELEFRLGDDFVVDDTPSHGLGDIASNFEDLGFDPEGVTRHDWLAPLDFVRGEEISDFSLVFDRAEEENT